MVNTCKSALKIVSANKRKWLDISRLSQNGIGCGEARRADTCFVTPMHSGRKQAPNPILLLSMERGNPVSLSLGRQQAARSAYGGAGIGCWKKRMLRCNGVDTGLNVTRHES